MTTIAKDFRTTLEMIKIEHTLFALPFALLGAVLAADGLPSLYQIFWITMAMIGARSAAMTFNRIADKEIDARNPRTAMRALPAGALSIRFARVFTIASSLLLIVAAWMLNPLAFYLSPVALGSVFLYSYCKRVTSLSHIVLGWCLAIAPTAAWIAVRGEIGSSVPLLLSFVVLLWTAGFDTLYACQDFEFDRSAKLHSLPARFGINNALRIARGLHLAAFLALIALYAASGLGWLALVGVLATGTLLVYQHRLVKADDLSKLNAAFFTTNAFVSVILFVTFGGAMLIK
ncbi:MAG: putative 4-hydroxybenzoate polyprenyltransferase [Pyrinomonadaceae bacterium MAG19_C2-C3]|nr:putative 4-hydroxybenzoate polyprenyltransferase [Pyrinomonadaceae bacterium MAG19_C2-C3]